MSVFLFAAVSIRLFAVEPTFAVSDLSADDRLLFTSSVDQPGWGEYTALFLTDLSAGDRIESLTYFPERARYFSGTGELEIQNRFGVHRVDVTSSSAVRTLGILPSFLRGDVLPIGRILPVSSSPDGRWIVVQEPDGPVRGRLVLHDTLRGSRTVISENQVLDYRMPPALWSPDSRYVLYARDGKLFHVSIRHIEESRLPDESYREFGKGSLASVRWTGSDSLYYLAGSHVKLVRPSEFFTRSFYADPLPAGRTAGLLPVEFDPHFDAFWPSPDGKSLIMLKEDRNLFLFPLNNDETGISLPFLLLPRESTVLQLWWRSDGDIVLLAGGSRRSDEATYLYRLHAGHGTTGVVDGFKALDLEGVRRFVPSPDRRLLAVLDEGGAALLDSDSMDERYRIAHPDPRDLFWIDEANILIVGAERSEVFSLKDTTYRLVALSSSDNAGFDGEGNIGAVTDGRSYRWDPSGKRWVEAAANAGGGFQRPGVESARHRVYPETLSSSRYRNRIMVRTVDGFGNRALFDAPSVPLPNPIVVDEPSDLDAEKGFYGHGSRTQGRDIALVFNAVDGDEGLGEVLSVLADYDIKATFFVGGDFIRRQPDSARMLADSRHEIGSLFYTHMDMTDFRYRIDEEFVVRGMGRNEDEFYRVTGKEVSTIWHTPWYVVSPAVLNATRRMNYAFVGRDVDPLDWVVLDGSGAMGSLYRRSPDLVERVLEEVRPGSIVPVRIGKPGKRDDYFFRNIDLLINGLLKDGYHIVSIGELMESTR